MGIQFRYVWETLQGFGCCGSTTRGGIFEATATFEGWDGILSRRTFWVVYLDEKRHRKLKEVVYFWNTNGLGCFFGIKVWFKRCWHISCDKRLSNSCECGWKEQPLLLKGTKDSRSQRFLFPDVTEGMIWLIIASPWICLVGDILLSALYHGSHHHFSPPFLSKKFFGSLSSKHRRVANRRLFLYDWPMEEGLWNARPLSSLRPLADGWENSEQLEVGLGGYKVGP